MAYSNEQIRIIHQKATAIPRHKYVVDNGDVYIGQESGRLKVRDKGLITLKKEVTDLSETTVKTSTAVTPTSSIGQKYKPAPGDNNTVQDSYEYYVHTGFEITDNTVFTVQDGGQLSIGDGVIINNGILVNENGLITA
jgi:hypothetical protein